MEDRQVVQDHPMSPQDKKRSKTEVRREEKQFGKADSDNQDRSSKSDHSGRTILKPGE